MDQTKAVKTVLDKWEKRTVMGTDSEDEGMEWA